MQNTKIKPVVSLQKKQSGSPHAQSSLDTMEIYWLPLKDLLFNFIYYLLFENLLLILCLQI